MKTDYHTQINNGYPFKSIKHSSRLLFSTSFQLVLKNVPIFSRNKYHIEVDFYECKFISISEYSVYLDAKGKQKITTYRLFVNLLDRKVPSLLLQADVDLKIDYLVDDFQTSSKIAG